MEFTMLEAVASVAVVLAIFIAVVLILAARKPDVFSVQRTATVQARPEKIFSLINDFRRWGIWSPWEHRDPAMKRTFSGAESGKGAVYAWDGNRNVGSGQMEILDAAAPSKIVIKLDFIKPFEGHNTAEFTMLPRADATEVAQTQVVWTMYGATPFLGKVMHLFIAMDKMIGKDFEAGLANLKRAVEQ
jgi:uncharacterized protein YndB with AHSA1/START domain